MDLSHIVLQVDDIYNALDFYKKLNFRIIFKTEEQALIQNNNIIFLLRKNEKTKFVFTDDSIDKNITLTDNSNNIFQINNKRIQKYIYPNNVAIMHYETDVSNLYKTFVNENGWDNWYTNEMKMDLKENGKIKFKWRSSKFNEEVTDEGIIHKLITNNLIEFSWNKCNNIFKSRVRMKFYEAQTGGSWINVEETNLVLNEEDFKTKLLCAVGWGEMLTLAKFKIEKGVVLNN